MAASEPDSSRPLDKSFFVSLIRLDHSLMVKKGKGKMKDRGVHLADCSRRKVRMCGRDILMERRGL